VPWALAGPGRRLDPPGAASADVLSVRRIGYACAHGTHAACVPGTTPPSPAAPRRLRPAAPTPLSSTAPTPPAPRGTQRRLRPRHHAACVRGTQRRVRARPGHRPRGRCSGPPASVYASATARTPGGTFVLGWPAPPAPLVTLIMAGADISRVTCVLASVLPGYGERFAGNVGARGQCDWPGRRLPDGRDMRMRPLRV
jgi:hypothetical protein